LIERFGLDMAMIKCSECGKDISDKAQTCPNCGCPISVKNEVNFFFSVGSGNVPQMFGGVGNYQLGKGRILDNNSRELGNPVKNGQTLTINCNTPITIIAKFGGFKSKPLLVKPGENYKVESTPFGMGLQLVKVNMFV
jgi:DNA-directed RNA polymerase subunit RPC12/RpoP